MTKELMVQAWQEHQLQMHLDSQFIIYTNMIIGRGINGIDTREYRDGNYKYNGQYRKHEMIDVHFMDIGVKFKYRYQTHTDRPTWVKGQMFLPYESIAGVELIGE